MIEIGYSAQQQQQDGIAAGTGAATTAGGSITGVGTGTGVDALVAPQTNDLLTSTSADATTPESQRQYVIRDLQHRLPPQAMNAQWCIWDDIEYWMDS